MGTNTHMAGVKSNGTCVATGYNNNGQCNVQDWTDIVQVSCGFYRTAGLKKDGTCVAVGYEGANVIKGITSWTDMKQISCGWGHAVGLKKDGTCVAVGDNTNKQLNVTGWSNIIQAVCGDSYTIGLKSDGTVTGTGLNDKAQLNVSAWTDIKQIACGGKHTVGLKKDGTCVAVGYSDMDRLNVTSWTDIVQVVCSNDFTVGLKKDGTIKIAGYTGSMTGLGSWTDIVQIGCMNTVVVGLKKHGTCITSSTIDEVIKTWTDIKSLYSDTLFSLIISRFILNKNSQYYTIKDNSLSLLSNQVLDKANFENNGFDDLNLLNSIDKTDMKLLIYDESNPGEMKLKFTLKEPFRPIDKFEGKIKILKQEIK